tara:strand:- start:109 stop:354 length:246 start_codon:yes stop_codon:yes gene_type:complete
LIQLKAGALIPVTQEIKASQGGKKETIPSRKKKGDTKRTQATKLCITLLLITKMMNQLLDWDRFRVARGVSLRKKPVEFHC